VGDWRWSEWARCLPQQPGEHDASVSRRAGSVRRGWEGTAVAEASTIRGHRVCGDGKPRDGDAALVERRRQDSATGFNRHWCATKGTATARWRVGLVVDGSRPGRSRRKKSGRFDLAEWAFGVVEERLSWLAKDCV
jgi:hypothetical protein